MSPLLLLLTFTSIFASTSASNVVAVNIDPSCSTSLPPSPSCTQLINSALELCTGPPCRIQFSSGTYILSNTKQPGDPSRVIIEGKANVTFAGAGVAATFIVLDTLAFTFSVDLSIGITWQDMTFDMQRLPFTLAQAVSCSEAPNACVFSFDSSLYPPPPAAPPLLPWLNVCEAVITYDPLSRRIPRDAVDIYALGPTALAVTWGTSGSLTLTGQAMQKTAVLQGSWYVLRHHVYAYNTFSAHLSQQLHWQRVTLHAAAGMGVYTEGCSDITLDEYVVKPRLASVPMSLNADALHFSNTRGGTTSIRNSVFEAQGDDGINMPTRYQDIATISSDRLSFTPGKLGDVPDLLPGDTLQFFSRHDLSPMGFAVVAKVAQQLQLTSPLPALVSVYDLYTNAHAHADLTVISNCTFKNNRARGILAKGRNIVIDGNTFDGCTGPAVISQTDGCYWMEGIALANWSFTNNLIRGVNQGVARETADVFIGNSVPVFSQGQPTSQCTSAPPGNININLVLANNTHQQRNEDGHTPAAVLLLSSEGVTVEGNSLTTEGPLAAFDYGCSGCSQAQQRDNSCQQRTCAFQGFDSGA